MKVASETKQALGLANLLDKRNAEVIQAAEMADPYAYVYVLEERHRDGARGYGRLYVQ